MDYAAKYSKWNGWQEALFLNLTFLNNNEWTLNNLRAFKILEFKWKKINSSQSMHANWEEHDQYLVILKKKKINWINGFTSTKTKKTNTIVPSPLFSRQKKTKLDSKQAFQQNVNVPWDSFINSFSLRYVAIYLFL